MPSGFKTGGIDLDDIFVAGSGGSATGYKVGGVDLSSRYAPYTSGDKAATTGYSVGGVDLKDRFAITSGPVDNNDPSKATDDYFANVLLLLHFDLADTTGGTADNEFVDSSSNDWTQGSTSDPRLVSSPAIVQDQVYSPNGAGAPYYPQGGHWALPGDFTIEAAIRLTSLPSASNHLAICGNVATDVNGGWSWYIYNNAGTYDMYFHYVTSGGTDTYTLFSGIPSLSTDVNYSTAIARIGSSLRAFWNGTQFGGTQTLSASIPEGTWNHFHIGRRGNPYGHTFTGNMDEFRLTKGVGRYSSNYTPRSTRFPDSA